MRYKYENVARDGNGVIISDGTVSVYLAGTTTAASIYTTSTSAIAVNSVTTSSDGTFIFYVDAFDYGSFQKYKYVISHPSFANTFTIDNLSITNVITKTYTISTAKTFPYATDIPYGVSFEKSGSGTIAFTVAPIIGRYQVFSGFSAGDVTFSGVDKIYAEWWGTNTTPGTTDLTLEIQSAINSQGKPIVVLPSGRVKVADITLVAGMEMYGAGPNNTILESYATTTTLNKPAGASQGYGLYLHDFSLKSMNTGATGISIRKENFINLSRIEITGAVATPWAVGIDLQGTVTDQQYNHSFYDVDVNFSTIGLNLAGAYTNEIGIFKGRFRLCGTGIKIDDVSGVKLNGINFASLSTTYAGPTYDGTGVWLVNGADVQSFGSRFENMDTAYKNDVSGSTNNIMSMVDIISQTSVTNVFWDGSAENYRGVANFPRYASAGTTPLLVPLIKLWSTGDVNIKMQNTGYDNIAIKNQANVNDTFVITNETSAVDYLKFNHSGTLMTTSGSLAASGFTATAVGASINLNNPNYDEVQIISQTSFAETVKLRNITQSVDYLWFQRDGTRAYLGAGSGAILWRASIPASGTFAIGDRIFNTTPTEAGGAGSKYIITGWIRLTASANNVLNTDWFEMRSLTGN